MQNEKSEKGKEVESLAFVDVEFRNLIDHSHAIMKVTSEVIQSVALLSPQGVKAVHEAIIKGLEGYLILDKATVEERHCGRKEGTQ